MLTVTVLLMPLRLPLLLRVKASSGFGGKMVSQQDNSFWSQMAPYLAPYCSSTSYSCQSCSRVDNPVGVGVGVVVVVFVVVGVVVAVAVVSSGSFSASTLYPEADKKTRPETCDVDPEYRGLVPALTRHPGLGTSVVYTGWVWGSMAAAKDLLTSRLWCRFRLESRGNVCEGLIDD